MSRARYITISPAEAGTPNLRMGVGAAPSGSPSLLSGTALKIFDKIGADSRHAAAVTALEALGR